MTSHTRSTIKQRTTTWETTKRSEHCSWSQPNAHRMVEQGNSNSNFFGVWFDLSLCNHKFLNSCAFWSQFRCAEWEFVFNAIAPIQTVPALQVKWSRFEAFVIANQTNLLFDSKCKRFSLPLPPQQRKLRRIVSYPFPHQWSGLRVLHLWFWDFDVSLKVGGWGMFYDFS